MRWVLDRDESELIATALARFFGERLPEPNMTIRVGQRWLEFHMNVGTGVGVAKVPVAVTDDELQLHFRGQVASTKRLDLQYPDMAHWES